MSDDILARLKGDAPDTVWDRIEAVAEIARLRAENAKLQDAANAVVLADGARRKVAAEAAARSMRERIKAAFHNTKLWRTFDDFDQLVDALPLIEEPTP